MNKATFYCKTFGMTRQEFGKLFKLLPALISYSQQNLIQKRDFMKSALLMNDAEFNSVVKRTPSVFSMNEKMIGKKIDFFKGALNMSPAELGRLVLKFPNILVLNEESIDNKLSLFASELECDKSDIVKMVTKSPSLLGLKNTTVMDKTQQIHELGITNQWILKNPLILTAPADSLKLKFMMFRLAFQSEDFTKTNWYIQSEKKTWARLKYFEENGVGFKPSNVIATKKVFSKKYKIDDAILQKKYPLMQSDIDEIGERYKSNFNIDGFEKAI